MNTSYFAPTCYILSGVFWIIGIILGFAGNTTWGIGFIITALVIALTGFVVYMIQERMTR